jgi:hypothetical protein
MIAFGVFRQPKQLHGIYNYTGLSLPLKALPQFPSPGRIVRSKDENLPKQIYESSGIVYRFKRIPKIVLMFLLL